jgi:7-carboxy-7-deazaguanine synthase (Cx14CxxC type)
VAYSVKEVFFTLQGEGANAGRAAVFVRFSGCNLWSGRAEDRAAGRGDCARWCDTDFVGTNGPGGGRFATGGDLASQVAATWGMRPGHRFVVCTGGEPLLQLDPPLIEALHSLEFEVAVETNGTIPIPQGVDWVCVSPKAGTDLAVRSGSELKVVVPQPGLELRSFERLDFRHFMLQPLDGPHREQNQAEAVRFCLENPRWRLSLQTHKMLGIP